jgi:hypothetical protein
MDQSPSAVPSAGRLWAGAVCLLVACSLALLLAAAARPASAQAAARGVVEFRLAKPGISAAEVDKWVAELVELRARWTRIAVSWATLQPTAPTAGGATYNTTYLEQIRTTAQKLDSANVELIITLYAVPRWASNKTLWDSPPAGVPAGEYRNYYAMDTGNTEVMSAFQSMAGYLAQTLGPVGTTFYECWNEPNIYPYLCPQTRPGDPDFATSTYLAMLKSFSAGVHAAGSSYVVIGGSTSPQGNNSEILSSPQKFATYLRDHGGAQYFDAYAHHPYPWTGLPPTAPPPSPTQGVLLSNLSTLLAMFPNKPFYLTEYGYSTKDMVTGVMGVTEEQQASYLRQSFAMVAKQRQVKAVLWFQIQDSADDFTGLRHEDWTAKPSWYAFAGRNTLTLAAPASARAKRAFTVSGTLTTSAGPLTGKNVVLQTRLPSQTSWRDLRTATTKAGGAYTFAAQKQGTTRYYRVRWSGVCESAKRLVRTP